MRTADSVRSIEFSKSMSGYKITEVEMFIEEIASDIDQLTKQNHALGEKLAQVMKELEESKDSQSNIQSVLVSAQRFADQVVNEAKQKAETILTEAHLKAREVDEKIDAVLAAFEHDVSERNKQADNEISAKLNEAAVKSESLITAAHDSVARQQLLFDKIKAEAENFKSNLLDSYKQQLELITKYPNEVPFDAKRAAEATAFEVDKVPDFDHFIPRPNEEDTFRFEQEVATAAEPEPTFEEQQPEQENVMPLSGFNVTVTEEPISNEFIGEEPVAKGLFKSFKSK